MGSFCHGNGADHCCYVDGQVCPFLEVDTVPGRKWVCGKRRELGSWEAVHNDPEYIEQVQSHWKEVGVDDCGDFMGGRPQGRATGEIIPQCCYTDNNPPVYNQEMTD